MTDCRLVNPVRNRHTTIQNHMETAITSFIIRFTQDQETDAASPWRGFIRHVQTNQDAQFIQIEDALSFMTDFIDLGLGEPLPQDRQNRQGDYDGQNDKHK